MARTGRAVVALLGAAVTLLSAGGVTRAHAETLGDARARAAALSHTVDRLRTEAEVATERYDAAQAQLTTAVADRGLADEQVAAMQANAEAAQQTVSDRALALYESGGDSSVFASLLVGQSPSDAVNRYHLADAVIAYDSRSAQHAAATLAQARALDARDAAISRHVIALQVDRQRAAGLVESLLASQRRALASADSTVRRIMRADQAAAAAAGAADFTAAVKATGGTVDASGTLTPPNAVAAAAIAAARSRLGVPYVWGATGPDSFDCSGLTQWSYAHAGISLPRTAAEQWNSGPHPSLADLEPGDLLFWALDTNDPATIHHVAMYIGRGLMIAAPHTGENVQVQPVYMAGFIGATRPWAGH